MKSEYFGVVRLEEIQLGNSSAHIRELSRFEDAKLYMDLSFVVVKERLPSEDIPGTGLFFPNVFLYKILSPDGQPYFLRIGQCQCLDYKNKTHRFGYYYANGLSKVAILDRNRGLREIELGTRFDYKIGVVNELMEFMIKFHETFNSDWQFYDYNEQSTVCQKSWEEGAVKYKKEILRLRRKCQN